MALELRALRYTHIDSKIAATAQSLAREFGPLGVHIAHAIIDGVIDIPRTKDWPVNGGVDDGKINSDAVSQFLICEGEAGQNTHNLDCRCILVPTHPATVTFHSRARCQVCCLIFIGENTLTYKCARPYIEKF